MEKTSACSNSRVDVQVGKFLEDVEYRRYSKGTVRTYRASLRDFGRFLERAGISDVLSVGTPTIEAYYRDMEERKLEIASVSVFLRVVRRFFSYLESQQIVFLNPTTALGQFRFPQKLMPVPSEEAVRALLAAPDVRRPKGIRDRALLETIYGSAARIGEVAKMKVDDVDLPGGTVLLFGKGAKQRVVPVGSEATQWLRRYIVEVRCTLVKDSAERMLWIGQGERPLSDQTLGILIRRYARKNPAVGLIGPHSLRRACATHMLSHGASPLQIQALLGHASLRHLGAYLRLSAKEIREMHARSRLGA